MDKDSKLDGGAHVLSVRNTGHPQSFEVAYKVIVVQGNRDA